MHEARGRNAVTVQAMIRAGEEIAAADAVDQHPHRDPAPCGGNQGVDEAAAFLVVEKDIAR